MGSPVKSRNVHLFPAFSGKRHAKTRYAMGCHGMSRRSHGKVRTKGGFQLHEQYCKSNRKENTFEIFNHSIDANETKID